MTNNIAIGAQALGGEADSIAVARGSGGVAVGGDGGIDGRPSTADGAESLARAAGSASDTPVPVPVPDPDPDPDRSLGLHSPPDSNNASKLDGSSSDSELSDLDDDALAETFRAMQADSAAGAAQPHETAAAAAGTARPASEAAPSDGPGTAAQADAPAAAAAAAADADDIGDVEPAEFSGTVPVFRPTMHQFRDFKKFMEKIDKYGMKSGIVKIIPPQEWKDSLAPLDEMVKSVKVREPIKQDIMGSNGTYRQVNILHQRTYNLPQWRQLCDQSEHQPPARRGERRANADKPKPAPRPRVPAAAATAAGATKTTAAPGGAAGRRGRRGRGGRKGGAHAARHAADDDTASVVSEPRLMTPESQRGDEDRMVVDDDDKACGDLPVPEKTEDDGAVLSSVEVEYPAVVKEEDDEDDARTVDSTLTDAPASALPRRMGFTRQASATKTQSTSARRKYSRREGSAKVDEAAFKDWDYRMDVSDYTPERCEELERAYWKSLTYAPPLYGADLPGTLFSESTELWNLNKLPNLLDVLGTKVPGVNTAYLYLGMWKATFAWHLEDVDLYSINYLHFGAPKQWYSISQGDARRFEAAMKSIWPADAKACDQFLRHKAFLISPSHLQHHYNIRVNKCVSYPGEFVVTYPYGYHSGYNLGYNCAEAVNFALESWLPMGKIAKKCECAQAQDSVWVDVYEMERKLRGLSTDDDDDYDDEEDEDDDEDDDESDEDAERGDGADDPAMAGLPTPPSRSRSVRLRVPVSRKRKRPLKPHKRWVPYADGEGAGGGGGGGDDDDEGDDGDRRRLKKMRRRLWSGEGSPCCLCPNDLPEAELLPTDDGREAHRMCALYLPETCVKEVDGQEVVANIANIPLQQLELRCIHCRLRKGVCLQCSNPKCSRSYHATCAAAAGVFVEEADIPVFADDGTEYKEHAFEFTCRFQRTKRDKRLDAYALEKSERVRAAAAALTKGTICQMQLYRSDIFAGAVLENRPDEEMLLLRVIPTNDEVEVSWKWLLLPDAVDYRLQKASAHALPLPEGVKGEKRPYSLTDGVFVHGCTWKEFHTCNGSAYVPYSGQAKVDLSKPDQLWYYLGQPSTNSKAKYTDDPANPTHNTKSNFLDTVPNCTVPSMLPPKRPPPPPAASAQAHALAQPFGALPPPPPGSSAAQQPGPAAGPPGALAAAEAPRRSYSVIKPPYVPHTSPSTSGTLSPAAPLEAAAAAAAAVAAAAARAPRSIDGFVQPQRPASKQYPPGGHRHHQHQHQRPPFGAFFSMPKASSSGSKFPQIQHPNLSHGYATASLAKPPSASSSAMSPPPPSGGDARSPSAMSPPNATAGLQASAGGKYSPPGNANNSNNNNSTNNSINNSNSNSNSNTTTNCNSSSSSSSGRGMHAPSRSRKSSTGAAALAAAAAKLHRRSASSTSSVSSFGLGGGLSGLSRPSPHTNYVGPPPQPPSTASSPFLSGLNMSYNTRPGSSVSSYASYESFMGGGPGMSPHSPGTIDASPFIGSPGPQLGAFDYPTASSAASYHHHHPGMRPQFGASWQQNFHAPLGSFAQDMDINFAPPSPISSLLGLPGGALGAPANIIPGQEQAYSFGGPSNMGADSMLSGAFGGFGSASGAMSPPLVAESPVAMSPTMELEPAPAAADEGTSQSPAEQLRQQLRSISDSSLPSSYRLRCLHQPRRRHQSRSSLNRIFTSQLLDLNPT